MPPAPPPPPPHFFLFFPSSVFVQPFAFCWCVNFGADTYDAWDGGGGGRGCLGEVEGGGGCGSDGDGGGGGAGAGEGKCSPPVDAMIVYVSVFRVIRKSLMGILRREVRICKLNVSWFGLAVRR